jgi:hypothetical protein
MSIYSSPAPGYEAQRDIAAGRQWAADLRKERARDQFDAKDLYDCIGGPDQDAVMRLCEELLTLVNTKPHRHPLALRGITEALQAITEPEIERRSV